MRCIYCRLSIVLSNTGPHQYLSGKQAVSGGWLVGCIVGAPNPLTDQLMMHNKTSVTLMGTTVQHLIASKQQQQQQQQQHAKNRISLIVT